MRVSIQNNDFEYQKLKNIENNYDSPKPSSPLGKCEVWECEENVQICTSHHILGLPWIEEERRKRRDVCCKSTVGTFSHCQKAFKGVGISKVASNLVVKTLKQLGERKNNTRHEGQQSNKNADDTDREGR